MPLSRLSFPGRSAILLSLLLAAAPAAASSIKVGAPRAAGTAVPFAPAFPQAVEQVLDGYPLLSVDPLPALQSLHQAYLKESDAPTRRAMGYVLDALIGREAPRREDIRRRLPSPSADRLVAAASHLREQAAAPNAARLLRSIRRDIEAQGPPALRRDEIPDGVLQELYALAGVHGDRGRNPPRAGTPVDAVSLANEASAIDAVRDDSRHLHAPKVRRRLLNLFRDRSHGPALTVKLLGTFIDAALAPDLSVLQDEHEIYRQNNAVALVSELYTDHGWGARPHEARIFVRFVESVANKRVFALLEGDWKVLYSGTDSDADRNLRRNFEAFAGPLKAVAEVVRRRPSLAPAGPDAVPYLLSGLSNLRVSLESHLRLSRRRKKGFRAESVFQDDLLPTTAAVLSAFDAMLGKGALARPYFARLEWELEEIQKFGVKSKDSPEIVELAIHLLTRIDARRISEQTSLALPGDAGGEGKGAVVALVPREDAPPAASDEPGDGRIEDFKSFRRLSAVSAGLAGTLAIIAVSHPLALIPFVGAAGFAYALHRIGKAVRGEISAPEASRHLRAPEDEESAEYASLLKEAEEEVERLLEGLDRRIEALAGEDGEEG